MSQSNPNNSLLLQIEISPYKSFPLEKKRHLRFTIHLSSWLWQFKMGFWKGHFSIYFISDLILYFWDICIVFQSTLSLLYHQIVEKKMAQNSAFLFFFLKPCYICSAPWYVFLVTASLYMDSGFILLKSLGMKWSLFVHFVYFILWLYKVNKNPLELILCLDIRNIKSHSVRNCL